MYRQIIQDSIDYIEDNLKTELSAQELSGKAGFSLFHYYRVFQTAVGLPYKAFVREFGCTPARYLKQYKAKKPYRINIFKEEHVMVSHKKATEILRKWGMEMETVSDIYYEGTGNRNESAYYVGNDYVLKFSTNLGKLKSHITISKALENVGLSAATPVLTEKGEEYVADGELYFCLTKRLTGQQMKPMTMYEESSADKARFVGEVIGQLSLALKDVEALVEEANIYDSVTGWAIPQLAGKLTGGDKVFEEYESVFGTLYEALPKQVIHRDPNPGNIILSGEKWGFIDFELSEKNVRVFDPCYAATAILSESFEEGNEEKLKKWIEIYKNIMYGYDDVVKLTEEEKQALPYVVLSNQLLALAWFAGQEKFAEVYETNKKMTEWLLSVFDELRIV